MGWERLGPSYVFISLVLGPLNSLLEESTDPNRYTAKAKFCFCKNNKRMIIIPPTNEYGGTQSLHCPSLQKSATSDLNMTHISLKSSRHAKILDVH